MNEWNIYYSATNLQFFSVFVLGSKEKHGRILSFPSRVIPSLGPNAKVVFSRQIHLYDSSHCPSSIYNCWVYL